MDILLKISMVIGFGIVGGKAARRLNLPNVTGYLIAGLFLGPSFLKVVTSGDKSIISFVNEVALSFIAFSIGGEFLLADLKKLGKDVFVITVMEVIGVVAVVFVIMYYIFSQSFVFSLIIASMSAATAPAGTMMVIRQYRAYGPLTNTILQVAALDDALGIMVFGIAMSVVKLTTGVAEISVLKMIGDPLLEIVGSLILGGILGVLLSYLAERAKCPEELLSLVLAFVIGGAGLANYLKLSPLLTCMMAGAVLVNLMASSKRVFSAINQFTPPINLLFFSFAGASLDLGVLASVGFLGVGYVFSRAAGKILGATAGALMVKAKDNIVKNIGMALLPQGGISIGLSMIVSRELPAYSTEIITVILFSVLVFEISGPILAKIAITRAGEVNGLDRVNA